MRWYHLAALVLIAFATAFAVSQTFTVVQPRTNKKGETKVVRPGEVVNTAAANSKTAGPKTTAPKTTIKEENPAPSSVAGVRALERERHAKRPAVKIAKEMKPPAKSIAPAPEAETAAAPPVSPAAKAAPPPLEPVPTLSKMSSGELQQRIESALRQNTNVAASGITVRVTDTEIHLGGTVANGQEKLEAERLAQSFGGNRLFKDDLVIKQ